MPKSELKLGDRVAVYDAGERNVGCVTGFGEDLVQVDIGLTPYRSYHVRQVRKLLNLERRKLWALYMKSCFGVLYEVYGNKTSADNVYKSDERLLPPVEFVEARRKK